MRSRTRTIDGVEGDLGETANILPEENSEAAIGETAPALNEVCQNVNSAAEIPMVSDKHNEVPMTTRSTSSDLNEEDLDFAWEHPLGKILLKQMANYKL